MTTGSSGNVVAGTRRSRSGSLVVVGCLVVGLALAAFAVAFQRGQTRRCLAYYGGPAAAAIQAAPRVELWDLAATSSPDAPVILGRRDISRAPGLVHLRRGLVEDANFDWGKTLGPAPDWAVALAFFATPAGGEPTAVLWLDLDPATGAVLLRGESAPIATGRIGRGLATWVKTARETR